MQSPLTAPVADRRTRPILFVVIVLTLAGGLALCLGLASGLMLARSRVRTAAPAGSICNTSQSPAGDYTVTVCVAGAADNAVVRGTLPVRVSVAVNGNDPGIEEITYSLDHEPVLLDYVASQTFELPTDHFGDGSHLFQVQVKMRDNFASQPTGTLLVFSNGVTVQKPVPTQTVPVAIAVSPAAAPTLAPTGAPFVAVVPTRAQVRPYVPPSSQVIPTYNPGSVTLAPDLATPTFVPTDIPLVTDTPFPTLAIPTDYPTETPFATATSTSAATPTATALACLGGVFGNVKTATGGVANATVSLKDSGNSFVITTATTNGVGFYQISSLPNATYIVALTVPPGYSPLSPTQPTIVVSNCQSLQQDFTLAQLAAPTATSTATPGAAATPTLSPTITRTPASSPTVTLTPVPTGSSSRTATPTATQTGTGAGATLTPVADAFVSQSNPTTNYGTAKALRIDASPANTAYLRFNVTVTGPIKSVKLNIYANSTSKSGFDAYTVINTTWNESTINYNNAPAVSTQLAGSGPIAAAGWLTIDVTSVVKANGLYSFALTTQGGTAISIASREAGATAPQLIITTGP